MGWKEREHCHCSLKTNPIAVGESWKAPRRILIGVDMTSKNKETRSFGGVYIRYSSDCKHWSTWQEMSHKPDNKENRILVIGIPRQEQKAYDDYMYKCFKLDIPCKYDDEALVKWILKQEPDFFEKNLPFIGYIQLLFEIGLREGQRISEINIYSFYIIDRMSYLPDTKKLSKGREDIPWRFKAK